MAKKKVRYQRLSRERVITGGRFKRPRRKHWVEKVIDIK